MSVKPSQLIEPFAGGGIISLTVAFENLADTVTMVERDEQIAAAWKTILCGDVEWLANTIAEFNMSVESVKQELSRSPSSMEQKAFQTLLANRVYHGGILAPGSGLIRYGENGKGISSRWYPQTLRKRLLAIAQRRDKIRFIEGDGLEVLRQSQNLEGAVFFIDPPYTASGKRAGSRLYKYSELDHDALFELAAKLKGDFLMTYDNAEEVRKKAERHGFDTRVIYMKNTHHAKMTELLIGKSLSWVRQ